MIEIKHTRTSVPVMDVVMKNRALVLLLASALVLSNLFWLAAYRKLDQDYMQEEGLHDQADALLRLAESRAATFDRTLVPCEAKP